MSIESRKTWLAVGMTALLASGTPGFVAPGLMQTAVAQNTQKITGTVVDDLGEPIIGANVKVKGTSKGAITDANGQFSVEAAAGAKLEVTFIGYATETVVASNGVKVTLKEDVNSLDDVVVVGYGTMKKSDLSGATVSMKESDLRQSITSSLDQTLQGKAAGVTAVQTSGAPGSSSSIRVRGQSTVNANAEPLYVIDGVIVQGNGNSSSSFGLGAMGNGTVSTISPLATINPQDIVSMEILKDASATAIYGAQGANGVVLITTKHGQEGKAKFSYDSMFAWSQQTKRLPMMNLREFATFQNDLVAEGEILEKNQIAEYKNPALLGEGTNWQDAIFQTGFQQQHQVSATGGTDKVKYYVSGSYMDQEGTIIGSNFDRFSVRTNLDAQLNKWMKLGVNTTFSTTNDDLKIADGEAGIVFYSLASNPDQPIYDVDGNYFVGKSREGSGANRNPVALAMLNEYKLRRQKLMGNIFMDIQPIKQVTWRSEFGFDIANNKAETYEPMFDFGFWKQTLNKMTQQRNANTYWQVKNYVTYADKIGEHNFSVMAGQESWLSKWEYLSGGASGLPSDDVHNIALGEEKTAGGGFGASSMASFFARGTYNFRERYYMTYTWRYDGSSNFGPENRWAPFNSVAGSWRFTKEDFMEDFADILSNGKVRLGWGQTGNANIGAYAWGSGISSIYAGLGNGMGYRPSNLSNPYIHWEKQDQINVGLDLGFLDDKYRLTVDYYKKKSSDMLMSLQLPSYMGTQGNGSSALAAPKGNYGSIENKGVEITIDVDPFHGRRVEWESNFQISINRNKLLSLDGTKNAALTGKGQWDDVVSRTLVGESLYGFYGYIADGVYKDYEDILNSPKASSYPGDGVSFTRQGSVWVGDLKFKDVSGPEGKPDGVINEYDKTRIGNPLPKFTFGWTNTFRAFNFDVSLFINGSYGNDVLNYTRMGSANSNTSISSMKSTWTNQLRTEVNDRARLVAIDPNKSYPIVQNGVTINYWYDDIENVKVANPGAKIPRASINADPNDNDRLSSRYVEDGSYIRLKNIVVGYTLPRKYLRKIKFENVRLYANFQNVLTLTKYSGYDPEVGASTQDATGLTFGVDNGRYPSPTTYSFGMNLTF